MAERARRRGQTPWWTERPGHRAETIGIALLVHLLMLISLAVGYRVYLAGLAAVSPPGQSEPWLIRPGEAAVALVLGLAAGGWLAGVWLGERRPRDWGGLSLLIAVLAAPLTHLFYTIQGLPQAGEAFAIGGLPPGVLPWVGQVIWLAALLVGGLAGAWWATLTPAEPD